MSQTTSLLKIAGKLAARDLTRAVYSGLLERDPDEGGADTYSTQLQHGGDLAEVIRSIAASTEYREHFIRQRADELVCLAFEGVLKRQPTPEELEKHSQNLAGIADFSGLLAAHITMIADTDEYFVDQFQRRRESLIDTVHSALLGRAADPHDRSQYADRLESPADLGSVIQGVSALDEHWRKLFQMHAGEFVLLAYRSVLKREPTESEFAEQISTMSSTADFGILMQTLSACCEPSRPQSTERACEDADKIVGALYQQLLGRIPSAEELRDGTVRLAEPVPIGRLVRDLSDSDEHWQQLLCKRRPELVQSDELWEAQLRRRTSALVTGVARALIIGRSGDRVGLAPNDVDSVTAVFIKRMRSIADSDRYFSVLFNRRRKALVNAVYQALLLRPVDPEGMTTYGRGMQGPADIGRLIGEVLESTEYKQRLRQTGVLRADVPTAAAVAANHVEALFQKFTGRSASPLEVSRCLAHGEMVGRSASGVLRGLAQERKQAERRVLLFGAYGNGNMGDAYQAIALQRYLRNNWHLKESQIFATSLLSSADFPFPPGQILPREAILDTQLVNRFDCLLIGGGGLIAHPHAPLNDVEWIKKVHTPILLLALGATRATVQAHRPLLERAWVVSGRDQDSVSVLKGVRGDAILMRDPILCAGNLDDLCVMDLPRPTPAPSGTDDDLDVLWVLKYPDSLDDIRFLTQASKLILKESGCRHTVVAIEPVRDQPLEKYLPGRVHYVRDLTELSLFLKRATLVVSMRYHGSIFAALAGKVSIGFSQPKIRGLYDEMLVPGCYEPHFRRLKAMIRDRKTLEMSIPKSTAMRRKFHSQFKQLRAVALMGEPRRHTAIRPAVRQL
jgi:Polysaccharide pyruvyl transferase